MIGMRGTGGHRDKPIPKDGSIPDLAVAVGPRVHHLAQPGGHGFDAHRTGRPGPPHRSAGRILRRTRARRRRADRHGWVRAQPHRLAVAVRIGDGLLGPSPPAPPDYPGGPRFGRQDPAANTARGTLCVPPAFGQRIVDQGADQPVPAARAVVSRRRGDHRGFRPLHPAGPGGRLRRSRSHGQRRVFAKPVPGVAFPPTAADSRPRSCVAPAPRLGAISSSATGCRWPTMSRMARAGTKS